MEQNNLLMVYMKSEQHCYWEQMFEGTEKDGRSERVSSKWKIKDKLIYIYFFSVLDDVLQTRASKLSQRYSNLFFSPYTVFQHRLFFDGRI